MLTNYPRALLIKARQLRDLGLSWRVIADRLGIENVNSLKVRECNFRKGRVRFHREKTEAACALAEQGLSNREIAEKLNDKRVNIAVLLWKNGFDREVRKLYRNKGKRDV